MKIGYKAVYHLMNTNYVRRSLKSVLRDVPADVFNASLLFAKDKEDYRYLSVMTNNREALDQEYVIFTNIRQENPIILKKDQDLSLLELGILCSVCDINEAEFIGLIEATCKNIGIDPSPRIKSFNQILEMVKPSASVGSNTE